MTQLLKYERNDGKAARPWGFVSFKVLEQKMSGNRNSLVIDDKWVFTRHEEFNRIFNKLLPTKLISVTDRSRYKIFYVVGKSFLRFLTRKPFEIKEEVSDIAT